MSVSTTPPFIPNAVHFDANTTGDYFYCDPAAVANGKSGTLSMWVKPYGPDSHDNVTNLFDAGFFGQGIEAYLKWSTFDLILDMGSGDTAALFTGNSHVVNVFSNQWHHVLASWDLAAASYQIYIDDVNCRGDLDAHNVTIFYTQSWTFGAGGGSSYGQSNADKSEFWFSTNYIDLSNTSNRRKFISNSLLPVYLGANGEIPLGSTPEFYLGGNATNYINYGTAGPLHAALSNNVLENVTAPVSPGNQITIGTKELVDVGNKVWFLPNPSIQSDDFNGGSKNSWWTEFPNGGTFAYGQSDTGETVMTMTDNNADLWDGADTACRLLQKVYNNSLFDIRTSLGSTFIPAGSVTGGGLIVMGQFANGDPDPTKWIRLEKLRFPTLSIFGAHYPTTADVNLPNSNSQLRIERTSANWNYYTSSDGSTWSLHATLARSTYDFTVGWVGVQIVNNTGFPETIGVNSFTSIP